MRSAVRAERVCGGRSGGSMEQDAAELLRAMQPFMDPHSGAIGRTLALTFWLYPKTLHPARQAATVRKCAFALRTVTVAH